MPRIHASGRTVLCWGRLLPAWVLLSGCRASATPAPPSVTPAPPSVAAAPADGWAALTWEERHDAMTWLVHPNMARLFQRFEQTDAPELTCRTCHGADAEQVQYRMPHGLPALDPAHMPDPDGPGRVARVTRFMADEVTPRMADLLGVPVYDPRTGHGFGCFGCHPVQRRTGSR